MKALTLLITLAATAPAMADPLLNSWFTDTSGRYARIYTTDAAKTAGTSSTTWSRGSGVQSLPTYAGVSEVTYSSNWVYIRTTGLGFHVMGPWYLNAEHTQNFPNFPANIAGFYRFPRVPTVPATKTLTGGGTIGYFVDGVALFDNRDTFSYSNENDIDASPTAGIGLGDGIWNRDAWVNEGVTFDPALAHQAGASYHYHANPIALRYLLGDHVEFLPATKTYQEAATTPAHSPILGWVRDGYPIYGPFGYGSAMDPNSTVRRMVSGFVKRDGANGTTNLNTTGRTTLPAWAAAAQNRAAALGSNQHGPGVSMAFILGHYLEDYDYLGNLTKPGTGQLHQQGVDFDLDLYNGRFCVTPEFPQGTYAYFVAIESNGSPKFPYNIGRQFYGSPTGSAVTTLAETVTTHWKGGPDKQEKWNASPNVSGSTVTLSWSAVEGGTYQIANSSSLSGWTNLSTNTVATSENATFTDTSVGTREFYKVTRTALAGYDSTGFNTANPGGGTTGGPVSPASGNRGSTVTLTITIPNTSTPTVPPQNVPVQSVTVGGSATGISALTHVSQYVVTCSFAIPAGSPGAKTVVVTFPGPGGTTGPSYTFTNAFTVN